MGRPKLFNREEVLEKAMPLFWKHGFAATSLQEIEKVTGVNKSGLYSEFKNKQDLFLESLRHYFENRSGAAVLLQEPLGWTNIETFLKQMAQPCSGEAKGCFGVNSMRDLGQLSAEAQQILNESKTRLKLLLAQNVAAEKTKMPAESVAEILSTFFSGLCIEQNLKSVKTASVRKVDDFIQALRLL
jgi:AcrR family transcriptional regulator